MAEKKDKPRSRSSRAAVLLECIGLDSVSFERLLEFALCEHLVFALLSDPQIVPGFFERPDALKRFRTVLTARTRRPWCQKDLESLFDRVKLERAFHYREPITYAEYLKLLWQVPLECTFCHKTPPEVKLHIDHVLPVSRGGSSKRKNLQFLCEADNLKKSNQREVTSSWLTLQ